MSTLRLQDLWITCGQKMMRSDRDDDQHWILVMGATSAVVMLMTLTGLLYAFAQALN